MKESLPKVSRLLIENLRRRLVALGVARYHDSRVPTKPGWTIKVAYLSMERRTIWQGSRLSFPQTLSLPSDRPVAPEAVA
jgi:hypothetical protein